jgi:23S rRNA (cytosine1962-C5)-methyltransferase
MKHPIVRLKPQREDSLKRHHPWVFTGALEEPEKAPATGDTVEVLNAEGKWLARGGWSPASQIRVRVWTFDKGEQVDEAFFRRRLEGARGARAALLARADLTALRLVNAESDGLPGCVIDRYGDWLVAQFSSAPADRWKNTIARVALEVFGGTGIFERSDGESRNKEGLKERIGPLAGEALPGEIEIAEGPCRYLVEPASGHKTGFYLDQRDNRALVAQACGGAEVLNCFSYTGGFGIAALAADAAKVANVDLSEPALALSRRNVALNGFDEARAEHVQEDVFKLLRRLRDEKRRFDVVVLDPPKFAASTGQVQKAARGYKDINMLAMQVLRPGGLLATFSCSGHIAGPLFQKIVADAALDARREGRILRWFGPGADHPVGLAFPEGQYLKGLLCSVA